MSIIEKNPFSRVDMAHGGLVCRGEKHFLAERHQFARRVGAINGYSSSQTVGASNDPVFVGHDDDEGSVSRAHHRLAETGRTATHKTKECQHLYEL